MPGYLVQLNEGVAARARLQDDTSSIIVFAGSSADAKAVAEGALPSDGKNIWASASVTEIAVGTNFAALRLAVQVLDSAPIVDVKTTGGVLGAASAAVAVGGTGYSVNDVVTLVGGTFTRAATFKVTAEAGGVVTSVALIDAGQYTALPSNPAATSGGAGDLTLTVTSGTNTLANVLAKMVGLLNATAPIAAAKVDMSLASPLLTVAAISDGIGDKQVVAEMQFNGVAVPGLVGAIVDEGAAAAVLSVAFPGAPVIPTVAATLSA
jgi:hypothetical protein